MVLFLFFPLCLPESHAVVDLRSPCGVLFWTSSVPGPRLTAVPAGSGLDHRAVKAHCWHHRVPG
eukprot:1160496-Pelagomonas_calceolata.AAC.1